MQYKTVLMCLHPDSVNGEGVPIGVFDDNASARAWLEDDANLRYATSPRSSEPTPVVTWEVHNSGHLHIGEFNRIEKTYQLSIATTRSYCT